MPHAHEICNVAHAATRSADYLEEIDLDLHHRKRNRHKIDNIDVDTIEADPEMRNRNNLQPEIDRDHVILTRLGTGHVLRMIINDDHRLMVQGQETTPTRNCMRPILDIDQDLETSRRKDMRDEEEKVTLKDGPGREIETKRNSTNSSIDSIKSTNRIGPNDIAYTLNLLHLQTGREVQILVKDPY